MVFLKISQSLHKKTCAGVFFFFTKISDLRPAILSQETLRIWLQNFQEYLFTEHLRTTACGVKILRIKLRHNHSNSIWIWPIHRRSLKALDDWKLKLINKLNYLSASIISPLTSLAEANSFFQISSKNRITALVAYISQGWSRLKKSIYSCSKFRKFKILRV